MSDEKKPVEHLHDLSVFDCPRIHYTRDDGCLTLHLGRIQIHVYGHDPFNESPEIVEVTVKEAARIRFPFLDHKEEAIS